MHQIVTIDFPLPDDILSSEDGVSKLKAALDEIGAIAERSGATVKHQRIRYHRTPKAKPVIPGAAPVYASPMSDANMVHEDQPDEPAGQ